jgi:hypothetical protein
MVMGKAGREGVVRTPCAWIDSGIFSAHRYQSCAHGLPYRAHITLQCPGAHCQRGGPTSECGHWQKAAVLAPSACLRAHASHG